MMFRQLLRPVVQQTQQLQQFSARKFSSISSQHFTRQQNLFRLTQQSSLRSTMLRSALTTATRNVTHVNPPHFLDGGSPEYLKESTPARDKDGIPVNVLWEPIVAEHEEDPVLLENSRLRDAAQWYPFVMGCFLAYYLYDPNRTYHKEGDGCNWPMLYAIYAMNGLLALAVAFTFGPVHPLAVSQYMFMALVYVWYSVEWFVEHY